MPRLRGLQESFGQVPEPHPRPVCFSNAPILREPMRWARPPSVRRARRGYPAGSASRQPVPPQCFAGSRVGWRRGRDSRGSRCRARSRATSVTRADLLGTPIRLNLLEQRSRKGHRSRLRIASRRTVPRVFHSTRLPLDRRSTGVAPPCPSLQTACSPWRRVVCPGMPMASSAGRSPVANSSTSVISTGFTGGFTGSPTRTPPPRSPREIAVVALRPRPHPSRRPTSQRSTLAFPPARVRRSRQQYSSVPSRQRPLPCRRGAPAASARPASSPRPRCPRPGLRKRCRATSFTTTHAPLGMRNSSSVLALRGALPGSVACPRDEQGLPIGEVTFRTDAHRPGRRPGGRRQPRPGERAWHEHRAGRRCDADHAQDRYGRGVLGFVENAREAAPGGRRYRVRARERRAPLAVRMVAAFHACRGRSPTLCALLPRPSSLRDGYAFRQHVETARRNCGLEMIPEFDEFPAFYFRQSRL